LREFLDDAHEHRDDGYGRAQALEKRELPKRFYKTVGVEPADGGFAVTLDGKPSRTPGRVPVVVPVAGIATTMAEEWAAQGERIDPVTMPMVRLVNSILESGPDKAPAFRAEIAKYAGNDLLLYRAEGPASLVAAQEKLWDAALVKLARHFEVAFQPTIGIVHQPQPPATLARLGAALEEEGHFVLGALDVITTLTGSGLLAIALHQRLLSPDAVWETAHVDEDFQQSQWGTVVEAAERRARRRTEFDAAVKLLELMRD
jgi:chaperone required for assembly of F1-ATPase